MVAFLLFLVFAENKNRPLPGMTEDDKSYRGTTSVYPPLTERASECCGQRSNTRRGNGRTRGGLLGTPFSLKLRSVISVHGRLPFPPARGSLGTVSCRTVLPHRRFHDSIPAKYTRGTPECQGISKVPSGSGGLRRPKESIP